MTLINTGSVSAALDTLHGARKLPPAEAIEYLRSFLGTLSPPGHNTKSASDARDALSLLINKLETNGFAGNDVWQQAIATMTSLANNPER
ncbi:MAG: hypothetical protein ABW006_11970 [Hyphomicrobium sp.]